MLVGKDCIHKISHDFGLHKENGCFVENAETPQRETPHIRSRGRDC